MIIDLDKVELINQLQTHKERIFAASMLYINAGFRVVPIQQGAKALPSKQWNVNYTHATNKPEKVKEWFGKGGTFTGWNIGLACGRADGIMVLDLDVNKNTGEFTGMDSYKKLAPDDYQYLGPVQTTPSGGRHYIYNWDPCGRSSQNDLGQGIDTRGGEAMQCKSHIVAWPSMVNDTMYKWDIGGDVGAVPQWIADALGQVWEPAGAGRGNEEMGAGYDEQKFSAQQIQRMLTHIPLDMEDGVLSEHADSQGDLEYGRWVAVGQAIHTQHPNEQGLAVWDEWSARGKRYQGGECHKKWPSFKEGGGSRIGSLIMMSQIYGYDLKGQSHSEPALDQEQVDDVVLNMNKEWAVVLIGSNVLFIKENLKYEEYMADGGDTNVEAYQILKTSAAKLFLENKKVMGMTGAGGVKAVNPLDIWIADERRREYNSIQCLPNKPQGYRGIYNTYAGFTVEPKQGDWSLMQDHILTIICNGDEDIYEYVLDWMADMYQEPEVKKGVAIVLKGDEGTGKGTFTQAMGAIWGRHFTQVISSRGVTGNFNAMMADAILFLGDEISFGGDKREAGVYKGLITEKNIVIERKGIDSITQPSFLRLVLHSNEDWIMPTGKGARRWLALEISSVRANDRPYFNKINQQLYEEDGLAAMLYDLLDREVTANLFQAPTTDFLLDQQARLSQTETGVVFMAEIIENGVIPNVSHPWEEVDLNNPDDWPPVFTKTELWNEFNDWHRRSAPAERKSTIQQFKTIMENLGFARGRPKKKGVMTSKECWRSPPHEMAVENLKINYGIITGAEDEES